MDPIWILVAFVLGFGAAQVRLPPLVGFLVAGFVLKALGAESGATIARVADLGVYLLLFGIGLKLKLRSLLRPEIWGTAAAHMVITVLILSGGLYVLGILGISALAGISYRLALLIAFALSFSSTVFAVKVLEAKAEMGALHGRIAIGILIMQDLFAIVFLTLSTGKLPSPWALLLLGIPLLRWPLTALMTRSGHGELLVLLGRRVLLGDATDPEFWDKCRPGDVRLVLLAMANHEENLVALRQLTRRGFKGRIAVTARFPDQVDELHDAGVHAVFDLYAEAGTGFAEHAIDLIDDRR